MNSEKKIIKQFRDKFFNQMPEKSFGWNEQDGDGLRQVENFISNSLFAYKEDLMEKIKQKNIDYLKKLCWSDKDIEYFLRQYNSQKLLN